MVFLNELGNLVDFFFAGQLSGQVRRSGQGAGAVFTDPAKVGCTPATWGGHKVLVTRLGWVGDGDTRTAAVSMRPAKVGLHAAVQSVGGS